MTPNTQYVSQSFQYIDKLAEIISDIPFDDGTIGSLELISRYQKSKTETPNTIINIFQASLASNRLENRLNKRNYFLMIRIRSFAVDREYQAQVDVDYLAEAIIEKFENKLNDVDWADGNLDNDDLRANQRDFNDNYYTKDILVTINKRVVTQQ